LLKLSTKDRSFPVAFFDRTKVNMTSYSKVEETDEEGGNRENFLGKRDKTMAALEAMPMCLNWGKIFSIPDKSCQHMVVALKHPKLCADKVN